MYQSSSLLPDAADVSSVSATVHEYTDRPPVYALKVAAGVGHNATVVVYEARLARDYFAGVVKAAQELVDAADLAILAEPLDEAS